MKNPTNCHSVILLPKKLSVGTEQKPPDYRRLLLIAIGIFVMAEPRRWVKECGTLLFFVLKENSSYVWRMSTHEINLATTISIAQSTSLEHL